jgi:acyl-CoA reductase-like NAD-dependent aldehyde dehydrogenase
MSRATGRIHCGPLDSPRLQRVLRVLADGRPHSTRAIIRKAHVAAVNAIVAELRAHGAVIACARERAPGGHGWRFRYTLIAPPPAGGRTSDEGRTDRE